MELERKGKGKKKRAKSLSPNKFYDKGCLISPDKLYDKGCLICLKRDHSCHGCPYLYKYPPGAFVGRFAQILCLCCGEEKPHPGVPGLDWEARAELKNAVDYPNVDEQLMELNITSAPEGAADGTERKRIRSEGAADGTGKAS